MKREPKIGDVLERKQTIMTEDMTIIETWKRGTIIDIMHSSIALEYEDGSREFVERGRGFMRVP